ncbi:MAG: hypothetical protein KDB27_23985 [Planctomycetales bacterium]|nr:hypothetical protein [Planctomycetales bacterium]
MFQQPLYTIVLVTYDTIARVDVRPGDAYDVAYSFRIDRPSQSDLSDAVMTAISHGPKQCGRLIILSDEFWTGAVMLANEIVREVNGEQLEQALALEAEPESGISPFESRLGFVIDSTNDSQTTWRVVQAEFEQVKQIATAAQQAGRVYAYSSLSATEFADVSIDSSTDTSTAEACEELVVQWLREFRSENGVAAITDAARSVLEEHAGRVKGAMAVAAIMCCACHYVLSERNIAHTLQHCQQLADSEKQLRIEIDAAEKNNRETLEVSRQRETTRVAFERQIANAQAIRDEFNSTRRRPVQILSALANTAGREHWIQTIHFVDNQVCVTGLALDNRAVLHFATRVEVELNGTNWFVHPTSMSIDDKTSLVRFEVVLSMNASEVSHMAVRSTRLLNDTVGRWRNSFEKGTC